MTTETRFSESVARHLFKPDGVQGRVRGGSPAHRPGLPRLHRRRLPRRHRRVQACTRRCCGRWAATRRCRSARAATARCVPWRG
nr:hypothetical protein [Nocardioides convexus]